MAAVGAFGTDTYGPAPGVPPRPCSTLSAQYNDSVPRSSLGTRWWNYDSSAAVHYGMHPDFVRDAGTVPGGADLIDNNFIFGADYFLQTWKRTGSP